MLEGEKSASFWHKASFLRFLREHEVKNTMEYTTSEHEVRNAMEYNLRTRSKERDGVYD